MFSVDWRRVSLASTRVRLPGSLGANSVQAGSLGGGVDFSMGSSSLNGKHEWTADSGAHCLPRTLFLGPHEEGCGRVLMPSPMCPGHPQC